MSAKSLTLITYGFFVLMPIAITAFIITGVPMRGGSADAWIFFGMGVIAFVGFVSLRKEWATTKLNARYLLTFDSSITLEEGVDLLQKYSYLMLISSILFFIAGIAALFVY